MLKRLLSCAAFAVLFFACGDDSVTNINKEAKEKASISYLLVDYYTGEPVDSVTIYNSKLKTSKLTDSLGISIWKSNQIGSHDIEVSKEGYATLRKSVEVEEEGLGDVARVPDVYSKIYMYRLGVEVNGILLYTDKKTGNKIPASGVTVVLTNQNASVIPREYSVKTDKEGNYSFTNLPEALGFLISVPQAEIDGNKYVVSSGISVAASRVGSTHDLGVQNLSILTEELSLVNSNLSEVDSNTTLTLNFSAPLDADSVKKNLLVKLGSKNVLVETKLSSDAKTINIKPFSESWNNNFIYSISGTISSKSGSKLTLNSSFTVGAKKFTSPPSHVSDLKIEEDGSFIKLSWTTKDTLITGLSVYYKTDSMPHYLIYDDDLSRYAEDLRISYSSLLPKNVDSSKISFIVLPYNNVGEADAKTAKSVSYTFRAPTAQVSDLNVSLSGSYVYLTWNAPSSGSYDYEIFYKTPSMDDYESLANVSYTDYETFNPVSYYMNPGDQSISFKVVPMNSFGQSNLSKAEAVTLSFDVDIVAGVKAEIYGDYFVVSWSKIENASNYTVYYKTSSMPSYSSTPSVNSTSKNFSILIYSHMGSTADTSISFKVVPNNSVSSGDLEDAAEVTIIYPLPEDVEGLTASFADGIFELEWTASTDTDIEYIVYYYTPSTMSDYVKLISTKSNSTSYNAVDLIDPADTEISFKVITQNRYLRESSLEDATPVTLPAPSIDDLD